ncbi:MAG: hypothetical protein NT141_04570, partial [candidate division WWE3 bacterium]|nr:hypothetical protein [candidate division WWE3 bacterium]
MTKFDKLFGREIIILTTNQKVCLDEYHPVSIDHVTKVSTEINEGGYNCKILAVDSSSDLKQKLSLLDPQKVVVLNWIEQIDNLSYGYHIAPQILEDFGFAYTGNDAKILLDSCDKIKIKKMLVDASVSTPKYTVLYPGSTDLPDWNIFPCILKPAFEHCSSGISHCSVVDTKDLLFARANELFSQFNQPLLVEKFIDGKEYFVAAWGPNQPEIMPSICQDYRYTDDYHYQIYDYDTKWNKDSQYFNEYWSHSKVKSVNGTSKKIYEEALKAIQYTGCQG